MTESLQERETEVDRWKDEETHWIKQATGLHEEKKKKKKTNHNYHNFSDSIHQHCKKHIVEEISSI